MYKVSVTTSSKKIVYEYTIHVIEFIIVMNTIVEVMSAEFLIVLTKPFVRFVLLFLVLKLPMTH